MSQQLSTPHKRSQVHPSDMLIPQKAYVMKVYSADHKLTLRSRNVAVMLQSGVKTYAFFMQSVLGCASRTTWAACHSTISMERILNMKKILISLASAALLSAAMPVLAGPDWQIIEHGRKVQAERARQAQAQQSANNDRTQARESDDGKIMKECMEMMSKSKQTD